MLKDDYKQKGERKKLIALLQQKGIYDQAVLAAMMEIPRHYFFTSTFQSHAYEDKAFPIGEGQTISQPYTVAFQTQVLHVKKGDKILEIGTGSGYQAAVLLAMGANVYSIERIEKLSLKAQKMLTFLGYKPILTCGDGTNGWALHAPYDKIIVTAGAPIIPEILKQQLKIGGILVIPVGNLQKQKMITVVRKGPTDFEEIELSDFAFVPLLGEQGWK